MAIASTTSLFLGVAWLGGFFDGDKRQIIVIGLILVYTASWFEFVSKMAIAEFRPLDYLLMSLERSGFSLIGACSGAWLTGSPIWAAVGAAAGSLAAACLIRNRMPWPSKRQFDTRLAWEIVRFGAPIAISMTMFSLIVDGSRLLIQQLDSTAALGVYTAASILTQNTLGVIGTGVSSAGYSMALRALEQEGAAEARRQLSANATLLLAVLSPATVGIALTGHCLATTLVGAKFSSGASELIPWMAAGAFFAGLRANHLDHSFQLGLRPHLQILVSFVMTLMTIGLCAYLIPQMGALGAAIAVTMAAVFGCVVAIVLGRFAYPIPLPVGSIVRIAACCALMAAAITNLPDSGWSGLILRTAVGAAVYGLAAIALNVANIRARLLNVPHWLRLKLAEKRLVRLSAGAPKVEDGPGVGKSQENAPLQIGG
jgi:O-antigen/teichoic acid export membrane protein